MFYKIRALVTNTCMTCYLECSGDDIFVPWNVGGFIINCYCQIQQSLHIHWFQCNYYTTPATEKNKGYCYRSMPWLAD